jgi:hypothetical protein
MVLATYFHLGSAVYRSEHVEYRLEHFDTLPEVRQRVRHPVRLENRCPGFVPGHSERNKPPPAKCKRGLV